MSPAHLHALLEKLLVVVCLRVRNVIVVRDLPPDVLVDTFGWIESLLIDVLVGRRLGVAA